MEYWRATSSSIGVRMMNKHELRSIISQRQRIFTSLKVCVRHPSSLTQQIMIGIHSDLEKTTPYTFILCATTRMGCGEASINRLLTVEKRGKQNKEISGVFSWSSLDRPAPPYPPTIIESSINATSLMLTWRKDSDFNYAPLRYTLIEYDENEGLTWKPYDPMNKPDGQITTLLIKK